MKHSFEGIMKFSEYNSDKMHINEGLFRYMQESAEDMRSKGV